MVCLISLSPSVGLSASRQPQPPPRIGTIRIVTHEVFEETSTGIAWLYRVANTLHARTRERVIRRELLFAPGDPLDPELLAQTERNLRALPFLRDARVEISPVDGGGDGHAEAVTVTVLTWDAWSTSPRIDFARVDNRFVWELGASEKNLLGVGKEVLVSHRRDIDRAANYFVYRDRQFVGSRLSLTAGVTDQTDGGAGSLALERPFFSPADPWSFALRGGAFERDDRLFGDGEEVGRLRHVARWADVELAKAVIRRPTQAFRVHFAYRLREDHVASLLRDFSILEVGVSSRQQRFVELTHVSRFETPEDFNLGAQSTAAFGISTPQLGAEDGTVLFFSAGYSRGFLFGPEHLLIGTVGAQGRRRHGSFQNVLTEARLRYLRKHTTRHALVGSLAYRHGGNLDREVQLLLGAQSGLRGYPIRQFAGTRSLLLTAEERWFVADDIGQLVSLGVAAFVDAGFAWPEGQGVDLSDLRTSLGIGLLVGRNRLSTSASGLRFDLAYALDPIPDRGRWVFTSGSAIRF